jgi:hypothetical protein
MASTVPTPSAASLKAEARVLSSAGLILLMLAFPLTMWLAWLAMAPELGVSPVLPLAAGGGPLTLGYLLCHFASRRMAMAKTLEG